MCVCHWLVPGIVQWVQQSWQFSHVGNLTRQNHPDIPTTLIYLSCNWDSFDWGDFFIGAVAWEDSGIWKQRPQKHPENEFGCKAARKMEKKSPLSPLQEKTLLHSHPSSYPGYYCFCYMISLSARTIMFIVILPIIVKQNYKPKVIPKKSWQGRWVILIVAQWKNQMKLLHCPERVSMIKIIAIILFSETAQ